MVFGMIKIFKTLYLSLLFSILSISVFSQEPGSLPVFVDTDGELKYTTDSLGNQIPDFSYCGYKAGNEEIPKVPVKVIVPYDAYHATDRIQSAIDYVATLEPDNNGFRGTVLLEEGTFELEGRLKIHTSGVVLRGSGQGMNKTRLIALGEERETLIKIKGLSNISYQEEFIIQDEYVPVNAFTIKISPDHTLKKGDQIIIHRNATEEWINSLKMYVFGGGNDGNKWRPGRVDTKWDVTINSVNSNTITFNSPITSPIDKGLCQGRVIKYTWPGRVENVGVENLILESKYDKQNLKDEDHCWNAISIENANDIWVRQVDFKYFAGSAVAVYKTSKQVTVEDCISTEPISEIGGERRNTFFTEGQQTLFKRCYAENGYHDFVVGFCAAGPNAFVQCQSILPYNYSGTLNSWGTGILYDNVHIDGGALGFKNRRGDAHGAGWTAAYSMLWQCSAGKIFCEKPPIAQNWAFGVWGQFYGDGFWHEASSHISPRSLYFAQLSARNGKDVMDKAWLLPVSTETTSSPSIDLAQSLTDESKTPPISLKEWISKAYERNPFNNYAPKIKSIDKIGAQNHSLTTINRSVKIENGWIINQKGVATGNNFRNQWWKGDIKPRELERATPHITRYVPGRIGTGYTDDLQEVISWMDTNHFVSFDHNYGLWYDRRRDDHERTRRLDGEVWPPFYELPFARSGKGTAWDGLSKYDLTKYNIWYWNRLKKFADLGENKGIILIHQNYFQHNILEAGAHWADFPWRTANNINNTGFPEPPPYAGDKRIFMAEQFYDISNSERVKLHKAFIKKCLDNFSENSNVIQMTCEEFTGPLHFMEFWIDVVAEWEQENNKKEMIGLSATKDVQDAILIDPIRSDIIDVIEIKYWHYRKDGSLYAPEGGKNLAPRQHSRIIKPGSCGFDEVYKAVLEYKQKFPEKAILYSSHGLRGNEWAVFMAGGSLAGIPVIQNPEFYITAKTMIPGTINNQTKSLSNNQGEFILYTEGLESIQLDLSKYKEKYEVIRINPTDGKIDKQSEKISGGSIIELPCKKDEKSIIWIKKL